MNSNIYKFNILHEEVSDRDLFDDSTHERVADNIFRFIESTDKAVTIGIEGSWGAGKSTVIELLRQKFSAEPDKNSLFFIFDTWAHDGNSLRRIFLQKLINTIDPNQTDDFLNELNLEIAGKKKTIKVETDKKPSNLGICLFILTLLVPTGAALLSAITFNEQFTIYESVFIFGITLSLAPIIFLFFYWFMNYLSDNKITWTYIQSTVTESYTQYISDDGEQTSVDFENYFKKIFDHSLTEENKLKKTFIIIDNLDRVEPEHALDIWSTLQTFFQHRSLNQDAYPKWLEQLWFIIPYDKEALSVIWKSNYSKDNTAPDSFLSKCIQIRAEVPDPVMTTWHSYLVNSVSRSLDWPDHEKTIVIHTYQRCMSKLDTSPTPRSIHNFVNQVGFIGLSWAGKISAEAITIYSLLRLTNSQQTLRAMLLGRNIPELNGSNNPLEVIQELAGLLFNVDKTKGIQLLLKPEIQKAMHNGDGESISEFIKHHKEGFWIAWRDARNLIEITTSHDHNYLANYAKAMHDGMNGFYDRASNDIKILHEAFQNNTITWQIERCDYTSLIQNISEMIVANSDFIDWCHQKFDTELSNIFLKMHGSPNSIEDEKLKTQLLTFSASVPFFATHNIFFKNRPYNELTIGKWILFRSIINNSGITSLEFVLPKDGVILEIANDLAYIPKDSTIQTSPSHNTFVINYIEALNDLLIVHPKSAEWGEATNIIINHVNNQKIQRGNNEIYQLLLQLHITHKKDGNIQSSINTSLTERQFWLRANAEHITRVPALKILAGYILKDKLQSNHYVSASIKEFWAQEKNEECQFILEAFKKIGQISVLKEISRDAKNKAALTALKIYNDEQFNNSTHFFT